MPKPLLIEDLFAGNPTLNTGQLDFKNAPSGRNFDINPSDYPGIFDAGVAPILDYRQDPNYTLEKYGELRQGTIPAMFKGLSGRLISVIPKFLSGAGAIGGLLFSDEQGLGKMYNNDFVNTMHEWDKSMYDNWFKVYTNPDEYEGSLLDKLGTAKFWVNDFADGLAYLGSAYAGGMGVGGAIGAGLKGLGAAASATRIASTAGTMIYNIATEASMEANDTYNTIKDQKFNQLMSLYLEQGMPYETASNMATQEAKNVAAKAASETFVFNAAVLAPTAYWESRIFFGDPTKAAMKTWNKFKSGALKMEDYVGMKNLAKQYASKIGQGIAFEGFWEENLQTAIQNFEQHKTSGYSYSMAQEIVRNMTGENPDGPSSIFIGGFIGGGMGIAGAKTDIQETRKQITELSAHRETLLNNLKQRMDVFPDQYKGFMKMKTVTVKDEKGNDVQKQIPELDENGKVTYNTDQIVNKLMELQFDTDLYAQRELAALKGDEVAGTFLDHQLLGRKLYSYLTSDAFANKKDAFEQFIKDLQDRSDRVGKANEEEVTKEELIDRLANIKAIATDIYSSFKAHDKNAIDFKNIKDQDYSDFLETLNKGLFAESVHKTGLEKVKQQLLIKRANEETQLSPDQTKIDKIDKSLEEVDNLINKSNETIAAITDSKRQRELYDQDRAYNKELAEIKDRIDVLTKKAKDNEITEDEKEEMTKLTYELGERSFLYGSIHAMPVEKEIVEEDNKGNAIVKKKVDLAYRHKNFLSALAFDYIYPEIETDEKLSRGAVDMSNVNQAASVLDTQNALDNIDQDINTHVQNFKGQFAKMQELADQIRTLQEETDGIDPNTEQGKLFIDDVQKQILPLKAQLNTTFQEAQQAYIAISQLMNNVISTYRNISTSKYATEEQLKRLFKILTDAKAALDELNQFVSTELQSKIDSYNKAKDKLKKEVKDIYTQEESDVVQKIVLLVKEESDRNPAAFRAFQALMEDLEDFGFIDIINFDSEIIFPNTSFKEEAPDFYDFKLERAIHIQALYNELFGVPNVQVDNLTPIQKIVLEESMKIVNVAPIYNMLAGQSGLIKAIIDDLMLYSQDMNQAKSLISDIKRLQETALDFYSDIQGAIEKIKENSTYQYFDQVNNLSRDQKIEYLKKVNFENLYGFYIKSGEDLDPELHTPEYIKEVLDNVTDLSKYDSYIDNIEDALKIARDKFPSYVPKLEHVLSLLKESRSYVAENVNKREKIQDQLYNEKRNSLFNFLGINVDLKTIDSNNVIYQFLKTNTPDIDKAIDEVEKKGYPIGGFEYILAGIPESKKEAFLKLLTEQISANTSTLFSEIDSIPQVLKTWATGLTLPQLIQNPHAAISVFLNRAFSHLRKSATLNPSLSLNPTEQESWFSSPIYNFNQHLSVERLINDINNASDLGIAEVTHDQLLSLVEKFKNLVYLSTVKDIIETKDYKYTDTLNDLKKTTELTITPNKQQQIVYNQMNLWDNSKKTFGYLRGVAGTGKSMLTSYFFGNKTKVFATAFGETATQNINKLLNLPNPKDILSLLKSPAELEKILSEHDYLVIDEFDGLTFDSVGAIVNAVYAENTKRKAANKSQLKVFLLGDPTQFREVDLSARVSQKDSALELLNLFTSQEKFIKDFPNNIFITDSLVVPYRSHFATIADVSSRFRNNINDVSALRVESQNKIGTPLLLGVIAINQTNSPNPEQTILDQVKASIVNGLSKVVVVKDEAEANNVSSMLRSAGVSVGEENSLVKVMTYTDVQSQTFDEVYSLLDKQEILASLPDIVNGKPKMAFYNTVMYMVSSRARSLLMLKDKPNVFTNQTVETLSNNLEKNAADQFNTKENLRERIKTEFELFGVKTEVAVTKKPTTTEDSKKPESESINITTEPSDDSEYDSDTEETNDGSTTSFIEIDITDETQDIVDELTAESTLTAIEQAEHNPERLQRVKAPTFEGLSIASNIRKGRVLFSDSVDENGHVYKDTLSAVPMFESGSNVKYILTEKDGNLMVRIIAQVTSIVDNKPIVNGSTEWTEVGIINTSSLDSPDNNFYAELAGLAKSKKPIPYAQSMTSFSEENVLKTGKIHYAAPEKFVYQKGQERADFLEIMNSFLTSSLFNEKEQFEDLGAQDFITAMKSGKLSVEVVLLNQNLINNVYPQLFSYNAKRGAPYLIIKQKIKDRQVVKAIALQPRRLNKSDVTSGEYAQLHTFWKATRELQNFEGFPKIDDENFHNLLEVFTKNLFVKTADKKSHVVLDYKNPITKDEIAPFFPEVEKLSDEQFGKLIELVHSFLPDFYDFRNVYMKQTFGDHVNFLKNKLKELDNFSVTKSNDVLKAERDALSNQITQIESRIEEVLNNPAAVITKIANSDKTIFMDPGIRGMLSLNLERPLVEYLLNKKGIRTPFVIRELRQLQRNGEAPFGPNSALDLDSEENLKHIFTKIRLLRRYISQGLDNFTAADIFGEDFKNKKAKDADRSNLRDIIVSTAMGVSYIYDSFSGEVLKVLPADERNLDEQYIRMKMDKFVPNSGIIQNQWNKLAQANKSIEGVVIRKTMERVNFENEGGKKKRVENTTHTLGLPLIKTPNTSKYATGYAKFLRDEVNVILQKYSSKFDAIQGLNELVNANLSRLNMTSEEAKQLIKTIIEKYSILGKNQRLKLSKINLFSESIVDENQNTLLDLVEKFVLIDGKVTRETLSNSQNSYLNTGLTNETFINTFNEKNLDNNGNFNNLRLPLYQSRVELEFNSGKSSFNNDLETAAQVFNNTFVTSYHRSTPTTIVVDLNKIEKQLPDAVQEPSTAQVLSREQEETGTTGSERGGMGQGEQGQKAPETSQEEIKKPTKKKKVVSGTTDDTILNQTTPENENNKEKEC